ncbi:MAG: hypothetical protein NT015_12660 [Alphaproteobacteria bacterium]|nr:hypothetical protein [Alphaproteobacteria bacterium]
MTTAPTTGLSPAATAPAGDIAAAHAAMRADPNLQFSMEQFAFPTPPEWLDPFLRFLSAIGPLMTYIFWGGVILITAFVLYIIGSDLLRRIADRTPDSTKAAVAVPEYRPTAARARALLEEADRLAQQGKFNEAVRVLLHRSIEDIERFFAVAIGPGLTSREIARLEPLSSEGRNVFSAIAEAVETSLFGGRMLTNADFVRARTGYATFAKVKA